MSNYRTLKKQILSNTACPKISSDNSSIHISINNSKEILSPYTEDNRPIINGEFASFLENSVKDVSIKRDLTLEIASKDQALDAISSAIKNYYYNEFVDSQRKLRHNLIASIITLLIGLIALSLTIILNSLDVPLIVGGAVDIFAWVFIWEAVDLFFFRRAELRYQQHRQINFINAKIICK